MNESGKVTTGERAFGALLKFAPIIAFLVIAFPAPFYFLWRYFTATEEAGVWMLFALTSLGVGAVAGLAVAVALLFARRLWLRQMRERLARDGVTVSELAWFEAELTLLERRTLRSIKNNLLADAYRENLAARLTATHIIKRTQGELVVVERRLNAAQRLSGAERPALERDLTEDRARLKQMHDAATRQRAEVETRLQTIAAAASRDRTDAEMRVALARLDGATGAADAVGNAKLQREYEEQFRRELAQRDELSPPDKTLLP